MIRGQLEQRLLVLLTLSLVAFGLVMVYSATSASAAIGNGDPMRYLERQAVYALLGLGVMIVASRVDYHRLRLLAPGLVLAAIGLCAAVLALAPPVNGARRWLTVGPATFQPSELAKLALCVWAASWLARHDAPRTLGELWRPIGLLTMVFCGLIIVEPDLGTAIALVLCIGAILLVAGTRLRVLASAGSIVASLGLLAIWIEPYRRERFFAFLDPWKDSQGTGFQSVQAMIGLGSGGLTGDGLGHGVQKIFYLPEAHTDMIYAIVGEELGLIGSSILIAAFALFAYAGFRIALRCKDPFGKLLAAGTTSLVCGQAGINLAAVLGVAPLTGIPLPFVSYGGSSLVVLLAGVGILLNIAVNHAVVVPQKARVPDRSRGHSRARPAGTRGGGSPARPRRAGDVRGLARPRGSAARP